MNGNLAYQEQPREELLNGKVYMMSHPSVNHNRTASNIYYAFRTYLKGKKCEAFADGTDVYLTENDRVIPDAMIICDKNIIKPDGIHGTPDLIVEVLSPSTAKNDKGYKMELYEKCGVKEYWIVEPNIRSIETYLLTDGKYRYNDFYALFPDSISVTDRERKDAEKDLPVSLYDDFIMPLEEIFQNLF